MTLEEARESIGRGVTYRPYPDAQAEDGVITTVGSEYVHVHFRGDNGPKACRAESLDLAVTW